MICDANSLSKYIDTSYNIFFIFGPEVILKNNSRDLISANLKEKGFTEKKIILEKDFSNIEQIIKENASGSLFGSKTLIEIFHDKGRLSSDILDILDMPNIEKMSNIAIIIRSISEKINKTTKWVKKFDAIGLMIDCRKLKVFEEKGWIKDQLCFMAEKDATEYSRKINDLFSGNLIAQQNEINILKLTYSQEKNDAYDENDEAEFLPYELEDKIIEKDTNYSLRIVRAIKRNDDHYGPLLVWIIGRIVNVSVVSLQNANSRKSLESAGIWSKKIPNYLNFIKKISLKDLLNHQKKIYKLDLASKGLGGISKDQFWQEIDNLIIELCSN